MHPIEQQWQRLQECKRFLKDARDMDLNTQAYEARKTGQTARELGKLLAKEGFTTYPEWKKSKENQ